jgi:hypothetical protein
MTWLVGKVEGRVAGGIRVKVGRENHSLKTQTYVGRLVRNWPRLPVRGRQYTD